jgi:putative phosphoesterase
MKLGVMSDTHDNVWKLEAACEVLQSVEAVVHCGDLCSPFMIRRLGERLADIPVHLVWGNNDGDPFLIARVAGDFPAVTLHGQVAHLELDGLRIGVNHYPEIARDMAHAGRYDLVCYGHDHTANEERIGETLLLNPGELLGLKWRSSIAIFDTQDRSVRWIDL